MGAIDRLLLASARNKGLKLLSGDVYFKKIKDVI